MRTMRERARNYLWLLMLFSLAVPSLSLAQTRPADERPVILAIGESTTAGFGVPGESSWPAQLQAQLDQHGYQYRVVNHGRSGSTTAMALNGLDRGLRLGPRIVIIALGGNDRSNRLAEERTKENLRKLVSIFVRAGAQVFLADRNPAVDGAGAASARSTQDGVEMPGQKSGQDGGATVNAGDGIGNTAQADAGNGPRSLYAALAAEEGAILMPSLREGVAGHPDLLLTDGSHPNAAGYTIIASRIFGLLERHFSRGNIQ